MPGSLSVAGRAGIGSCADLWNKLANMTSLHIINPDGAYDGKQRSLENFQFDLENVLTMSQLIGWSAEERNAASVLLDILAGTKNKTAAEVAAEVVTEAPRISGQKVLYAVLCSKYCRTSQSDRA